MPSSSKRKGHHSDPASTSGYFHQERIHDRKGNIIETRVIENSKQQPLKFHHQDISQQFSQQEEIGNVSDFYSADEEISASLEGSENASNCSDPDVKPQEYLHYLNERYKHFNEKKWKDSSIDDKIDKVDPCLVAKFKVKELYQRLVKNGIQCTKRGVRMIIDHQNGSFGDTIKLNDLETQQQLAYKKRIDPTTSKAPTAKVSRAIRQLAEKSGLFAASTGDWYREKKSTAGAFFVEKSNGLLRVIIDGRLANTCFDASQGKFSLFTIETVRQVIDNLSVKPGTEEPAIWYALNMDLRHWFHQLPLPIRLQNYFHLKLTDRNNRESLADYYMHPTMVPMGWTLAPFIAQCCTWSLLLTPNEKDTPDPSTGKMAHGLGEQLQMLHQQEDPPIWVPLKEGGGIFVLLDNILIVTPNKKVADFWFSRLINNSNEYHGIIKHEGPEFERGELLKARLEKECYHTMMKGSDTKFSFYGVEWQHSRHRVPVKSDDSSEHLPDYDPETRRFTTRRKLASVLGKILWHRRIHRKKLYDDTEESTAIMSLYSRYTPKERAGWNHHFEITVEEERGLLAAWRQRCAQEYLEALPLSLARKWSMEEIEWAAADAAGIKRDGEQALLAGVRITRQTAIHTSLFTKQHRHKQIAVAELQGINDTVAFILNERQNDPPKIIVLATDSQNAKNWVEKGHAKNKQAMALLRELDQMLEGRRETPIRLYLVYVKSEDNVADTPSRGGQALENRRLENTLKALEMASASAQGLWRISGGITGGKAIGLDENRETARRQRYE